MQRCEVGQLDWIETAVEGGEEPERPAPVVLVTADAPTDADLNPAPEEETGEEATTGTGAESAPTDSIATTVVDDAEEDSDDDDSNTGLIIGVIVAVIVIGGGAYVISRRRAAN